MSSLHTVAVLTGLLLACAIKSTVIFALAAGVAVLARQQSAAFRHQIWTLAILCALLLPIFQFALPPLLSDPVPGSSPSWSTVLSPTIPPLIPHGPSMVINAVIGSGTQTPWKKWLFYGWAAGFVLVALRTVVGLARLLKISAQSQTLHEKRFLLAVRYCAQQVGVERPVCLLRMPDSDSIPCTWGILLPRILLPSNCMEWSDERRDMVLTHELAHTRRMDWPLHLLAEALRAVYWFHPLAWWAIRNLRQESERACDDAVLIAGQEPAQYARELLSLVRTTRKSHDQYSTALAVARPSYLERRITAMLNPSLNRHRVTRTAQLFTATATLMFLLPLAALRAPAQTAIGSVKGSILDPRGAFVPAATIIMSNVKTHTRDMTTTDATGVFQFASLPSGEYEMRVLKPGFKEYTVSHVSLDPARDTVQNVKLEMGSISEQVQVHETLGTAPTRLAISGSVQAAALIHKAAPAYPPSAKAARVQGSVILEATIGADGIPVSLQVVNAQIDPDLARSAVEAVSQWRYRPTLLNGQPIEVRTNVTVNYTLAP